MGLRQPPPPSFPSPPCGFPSPVRLPSTSFCFFAPPPPCDAFPPPSLVAYPCHLPVATFFFFGGFDGSGLTSSTSLELMVQLELKEEEEGLG